VGNQPGLGAMNGGQSQNCFECRHFGVVYAAGSGYDAQTFFSHFEGSLAREDPAKHCRRSSVETPAGFFAKFALCHPRGAARQAARTLGISDPLSKPKQDMLVT